MSTLEVVFAAGFAVALAAGFFEVIVWAFVAGFWLVFLAMGLVGFLTVLAGDDFFTNLATGFLAAGFAAFFATGFFAGTIFFAGAIFFASDFAMGATFHQ
jgi:hypothetical protein